MTVKEVFNLRKQGKIEEAYEAIRPMYAVHKGKYTTLCMYIVAKAIFNKRILENRISEAAKIYEALKHVVPNIDDPDGRIKAFMQFAKQRLAQVEGITDGADNPSKENISAISAFSAGPNKKICDIRAICVTDKPAAGDISALSAGLDKAAIKRGESHACISYSEHELSRPQVKVLDCIRSNPGLRVPMISEGTNIPSKSIERHISVLISRNLIEHRGSKKTGGYYAK